MKVAEYRDLISDVSDTFASARSAADETELERECYRLCAKIKALEGAACPRASERDRARAAQLLESAQQFTFSSLMMIHDNQRLEAEYLGTPR